MSKKILLKLNRAGVMSIGTGQRDGSIVQLIPGPNYIPVEKWNMVKDNPIVKARMEQKIVDPERGKVPIIEMIETGKKASEKKGDDDQGGDEDQGGQGIGGLNAGDAKSLIKETFNTVLLREWREEESRSTVVKAIDDQLQAIDDERNEGDSQE